MGIFSGNKKKDKLVLVFDIGSSSVGGVLFFTQNSGIPKIVFSVREPIAIEGNIEADRFLYLTIKSLETVASQIHKSGIGVPEEIFCVLSSPWHISQTRVIRLEKNTPFIFTPKLALDLIKKEIVLFEEEYSEKYPDIKSPIRSIEFKNTKIMLNGYETSKPLDQKTTELEMTLFVSISPEQILKNIEKTINRHFHVKEIKFSSFTMASFAIVRDTFANQDSFLLIDIGGEVTDISMVKGNVLCESISFPLGINFMIRGVAFSSLASLNEARSLISLFKDNHAVESTIKKIGPIIEKLRMDWLSNFQESLSRLSKDISVPATIYLVVDKELANFFSETIKTEQFNQYTLTESKFKVVFLDAEVFHTMATFKESIKRDSVLIIDSIYINRFLINPSTSG